MNHAVGVPEARISALAMRFVRSVTASASWTAGVLSKPRDITEQPSITSATIGIARNASVIPVIKREQSGERSASAHHLSRWQPEPVGIQRPAAGLAGDLLDEGRRATRVRARRATVQIW